MEKKVMSRDTYISIQLFIWQILHEARGNLRQKRKHAISSHFYVEHFDGRTKPNSSLFAAATATQTHRVCVDLNLI